MGYEVDRMYTEQGGGLSMHIRRGVGKVLGVVGLMWRPRRSESYTP